MNFILFYKHTPLEAVILFDGAQNSLHKHPSPGNGTDQWALTVFYMMAGVDPSHKPLQEARLLPGFPCVLKSKRIFSPHVTVTKFQDQPIQLGTAALGDLGLLLRVETKHYFIGGLGSF